MLEICLDARRLDVIRRRTRAAPNSLIIILCIQLLLPIDRLRQVDLVCLLAAFLLEIDLCVVAVHFLTQDLGLAVVVILRRRGHRVRRGACLRHGKFWEEREILRDGILAVVLSPGTNIHFS